ncbi:hypothetical protein ACVWYI_006780 [Bradyrhizobium sp. LB13.1]
MHRLVLCVWLAVLTSAAFAFDNGQYDHVPPDVRAWFKSVIAPNGVPCCDVSDGHRTDYDVRSGAYWVPIEGQWMQVLPSAPSSVTAAIRSARPWCGTSTTAALSSSAASCRRMRCSRRQTRISLAENGPIR